LENKPIQARGRISTVLVFVRGEVRKREGKKRDKIGKKGKTEESRT
jgi:hypothetical protein